MNRFHLQAADRSFKIVTVKSRATEGLQIPSSGRSVSKDAVEPEPDTPLPQQLRPGPALAVRRPGRGAQPRPDLLAPGSRRGRRRGLVIPPIVSRAEDGFTLGLSSGSVCPGSLWDTAGLQRTLGDWCPGLQIRTTPPCGDAGDDSTSGAVGKEKGQQHVKTVNLPARSYKGSHHNTATSFSSSSSMLSFRELAQGFLRKASLDAEPVIVRYGDPYLAWDYARSGEMATLRRELLHALRYNSSLTALGRAVFDQIAQAAGGVDGLFIGVHLHDEGDLPKTVSAGVEGQMRHLVKAIKGIATSSTPTAGPSPVDLKKRHDGDVTLDDSKIRTVYVSCRDQSAIQKFRDMLEPLNYKIYDWRALLGPPPGTSSKFDHQRHPGNETLLAQIEALVPDQRDVVEYEVLVGARYWIGVSTSPLSTLIAYARSDGDGGATENAEGLKEEEEQDAAGWFVRYVYPRSSKAVGADGGTSRVRVQYVGQG
ncbi:uncharacterized protein PG986_006447 [Apiospora aurea]|uniref:Uncharacterized protein n=1 Tax=Apiospora aurea TaxID=335848 RepID=A0ABR1QKG3_9PEZI